jgi:hypothetical protein
MSLLVQELFAQWFHISLNFEEHMVVLCREAGMLLLTMKRNTVLGRYFPPPPPFPLQASFHALPPTTGFDPRTSIIIEDLRFYSHADVLANSCQPTENVLQRQ